MNKTARKEMIRLIRSNKMDLETAFNALVKDGICPALIYDDFGNWAVCFEGYQKIPANPPEPDDIDSTFFIKKEHWQRTIKGALLNALNRD